MHIQTSVIHNSQDGTKPIHPMTDVCINKMCYILNTELLFSLKKG